MTKFPPGFYKTRHGVKAEVLAEREGALYGYAHESACRWQPSGAFDPRQGETCLDLLSPWVEAEKPFECWVNRYKDSNALIAEPTEKGANAFSRNRIGPAIHMIESTPLTLAAGEMLEMLERFVRPSKDVTRYDEARALICRARGET